MLKDPGSDPQNTHNCQLGMADLLYRQPGKVEVWDPQSRLDSKTSHISELWI